MSQSPVASSISHFVFDMDGTLTDTWPVALKAFRAAISAFTNREYSNAELVAMAGPDEAGILQRLFPDDWERCFERYLQRFRAELGGCDILYPGVLPLLEELQGLGKSMAINSGKANAAVKIALDHAGITRYFDEIEGGSATGDIKAERLSNLSRRHDVPFERMAYIGDSAKDMAAARAAGVLAIGAAWDARTSRQGLICAGADIVFDDVPRLRAWITEGAAA